MAESFSNFMRAHRVKKKPQTQEKWKKKHYSQIV